MVEIKAARINGINNLQSSRQFAEIHGLSSAVADGGCWCVLVPLTSPYLSKVTHMVTRFVGVEVPTPAKHSRCQRLQGFWKCKERNERSTWSESKYRFGIAQS